MAERLYATVSPALLRWARSTSGLTLAQASKRIGLTAPERLADLEAGRLHPTVRQLREAARVYKRPLAAFFLPTPPEAPESLHDFRRLPGVEVPEPSPEFLLEIRRARRRRAVALELLAELEGAPPPFTLRTDLAEDISTVGQHARRWLGVDVETQQRWTGEYDGLNSWIAILEARGVLVFQAGDVPLDEMRGFSISEASLPVIVLNGKDPPRARVFTLMHEFTHLMLSLSGVCDPIRVRRDGRTADERVEVFCNRAAGAILVPESDLLSAPGVAEARNAATWDDAEIESLARRFAVSREVILVRLLSLGRTHDSFVSRKFSQYRREYLDRAARPRERGYPQIYRMAVRDNGRRYTRLVLEALERDRITLADVSDYLGVRLKHLPKIADAVQASSEEL